MKGYSSEAIKINNNLIAFRQKIEKAILNIELKSEGVTIESLKNEINPQNNSGRLIGEIFSDHNNKVKALIGQSFAFGTFQRYETTLKHLKEFLKWKYKLEDIDVKKINLAFINDFEFYLRTVRKCENNSAVKYIRNFGKVIRICLSYNWIDQNPFLNYKSRLKVVDRLFLSDLELQRIWEKDFGIERLNLVKDIFVFSCYTGLAYVDVQQLTPNHLVIGIDGEKWIHTSRQKTDIKSHIPLLPIPLEIVTRYSDHPSSNSKNTLLPILSNQKMNAYLKEIADLSGINKELTFHIARHTFATTVTLTNGVPLETVSKMLGHTSMKTTQHYAKILDMKISSDMRALREKFAMHNKDKNHSLSSS